MTRGRVPKDPALVQRRNVVSTRAHLRIVDEPMPQPQLPRGREWDPLTRAWWHDVWHSPLAGEYLRVDVQGLYMLAFLVDRFWTDPSISLAGEIRQQGVRFGLSPIDRRRLQWAVEKVEEIVEHRRPRRVHEDIRGILEQG